MCLSLLLRIGLLVRNDLLDRDKFIAGDCLLDKMLNETMPIFR